VAKKNRDIDLLKIQILAESYHTLFNTRLSFLLTAFIALLVAFITLVIGGQINFLAYYVAVVLISIPISYWIRQTTKHYSENLDRIDDLFTGVENGETLLSLKVLRKTKTLDESILKQIGKKE
jgi:hypothetical protein